MFIKFKKSFKSSEIKIAKQMKKDLFAILKFFGFCILFSILILFAI